MASLLRLVRSLQHVQQRERVRIVAEVMRVRGLMPLLMKPRNGQTWSRDDRAEIRLHLRRLAALSPYIFALALPAAPLTLPLLAWWLDRRRARRQDEEAQSPRSSNASLDQ